MEEKIIISVKAKISGVMLGIIVMIFGGLTMGSCLMWEDLIGGDIAFFAPLFIGGLIIFIGIILMFGGKQESEICVTDKRVYGRTLFGKRVDLPLDSISAVALTFFLFFGVSVSTSSGRITFFLIPERNKVHKAISDLIIERQIKPKETVIKQEAPQSNADELKKYKDLLDNGVITPEEFEAKKKQLLEL